MYFDPSVIDSRWRLFRHAVSSLRPSQFHLFFWPNASNNPFVFPPSHVFWWWVLRTAHLFPPSTTRSEMIMFQIKNFWRIQMVFRWLKNNSEPQRKHFIKNLSQSQPTRGFSSSRLFVERLESQCFLSILLNLAPVECWSFVSRMVLPFFYFHLFNSSWNLRFRVNFAVEINVSVSLLKRNTRTRKWQGVNGLSFVALPRQKQLPP